MILPATMHQTTVIETEIPGAGKQELATEIPVDGKIYQKLPLNIETGRCSGFATRRVVPDLEQMMSVENAAAVTPSGLEDYLYYRLLGTAEMNGEEVYEIVTYGAWMTSQIYGSSSRAAWQQSATTGSWRWA